MRATVLAMAILALSAAGATEARDGGEMRDPFFPSAGRPPAPAATPRDLQLGRDPFANPLGRPATAPGRPAAPRTGLTGIIYGKQARLAIYNGEVLAEGAMAGDKRLMSIRKRSVVLMTASGRYEEVFLEDFTLGR